MKTKYFMATINGISQRIYYYPELSTPTHKAVILSRFAVKKVKLITSGNRNKDKTLLGYWLEDNGLCWDDLPTGCEIHHNAFGDTLEWIPKEIHRQIKHRGGISIVSQALKSA